MKRYRHITSEERSIIAKLRQLGYNKSQIAKHTGRHRTTISREFQRNTCIYDGAYRPTKAHARALNRRSESRKKPQFTDEDLEPVFTLLNEQWSPDQISSYLKINGKLEISHETIYQRIWKNKSQGGQLWKQLRQSGKKRRKRYGAYDSRGRLANKRMISERPLSAEQRLYKGHLEIDTVMGKGSKDCIVTLVDRKTRFTQIGKLPNRTTEALNKKVIELLSRFKGTVKTITADNGTEFHQYPAIEQATGTRFYFAKPYHSWERGTNENTNGLIRQYLPKGTSMASITQQDCDFIANRLNSRPRKILGYKTPATCQFLR